MRRANRRRRGSKAPLPLILLAMLLTAVVIAGCGEDSDTSATEAVAVDDALVLIPRVELERSIRETFVDEEI